MKISHLLLLLLLFPFTNRTNAQAKDSQKILQIVYTSDQHYGITRKNFQGAENVNSRIVNKVLVAKINSLPGLSLPQDNGVGAGKKIGYIDYLAQTGDIANRQEVPLQSATVSWHEFAHDYLKGLTTKDHRNKKTRFLIVPGNHDVSNAIGHYKSLQPLTDATAMVSIYNLMMHPAVPKTNATFNYATDKVNYSRDISGIHFMFITIWPDSLTRIWMERDLQQVSTATPVIIFAHDPPDGDPKHFMNPVAPYTINAKDKFENLLTEKFKDSVTVKKDLNDKIEQRGFVAFIKKHPNIKAYFHGHSNANEYYYYKGPDNDINLPAFRVDSPMKGKSSSTDETKLSFQFIAIDTRSKTMTVRECLWDTAPDAPASPLVWGESSTISLK
ncbi:calcineurin-like phosphoesterase family protein [Chitinophaga niastensis]|uniref:Calcineurin-like phosphoesterase family protein n=1 Tax=Chitinophaga niastensis TaxID=536980 RepID=A0A2P8HP25_CHINA|nr:metallophosphoesterase [Chitinophaga niastensis]PSL47958.1 calcineurin-like phosphoesterase family protein [Chitinophaga niastensis]